MLEKQDNCQVAVSVSMPCDQAIIRVAWQLHLLEEWATDAAEGPAGVPEAVEFATQRPSRRSP